jgi:hypothetical protein
MVLLSPCHLSINNAMHAVTYTEGKLHLPPVTAPKDGNPAISDSSVGVILRKWPGV